MAGRAGPFYTTCSSLLSNQPSLAAPDFTLLVGRLKHYEKYEGGRVRACFIHKQGALRTLSAPAATSFLRQNSGTECLRPLTVRRARLNPIYEYLRDAVGGARKADKRKQ